MSGKGIISYGSILRMTLPVMFGMMAEYIVYIINSAFLSRVDGQSFVASGNAGLVYVSLMMIGYGIAGAAQIIIARRDGEKDYKAMSNVMWNNFLLIGIINVSLFLLLHFGIHPVFNATVQSPELANKMSSFMGIRAWGIFFSILELGFFAYYTGIGKTIPVMCATIMQGLTNFIFDYLLIFGYGGFPEMGLEGAAWSTVISDGFSGLTYVLFFIFYKKEAAVRHFFKNKFSAYNIKELVRLGLPLIGQGFVSVGSWTIFFFLIEHMGQDQVEVSQTIRSFYYVCLASVLAFGTTTKTMVSKLMAEKKTEDIRPTLTRIITCSLIITFIFTHANFFYPQWVVPVINANPGLLSETVLTLRLVSAAMILFSISVAFINMISGAGDTRASFLIEFFAIIVYIILAWLLTSVYPQPIHLVWSIEYVYFGLMIFVAALYIRRGKWKTIKI